MPTAATTSELQILVGEDKTPLRLTDSAVQTIQDEAARHILETMASVWATEKTIPEGEGFDTLTLDDLLGLRDMLRLAGEMAEVLIECRPLSELDLDDEE